METVGSEPAVVNLKQVSAQVVVQAPPLCSQVKQLKLKRGALVAQHNGSVQNLALGCHELISGECHPTEIPREGTVYQEDAKPLRAPKQQEKW